VTAIDADKIAGELGNSRLVNIILLGVISNWLDFDKTLWEDVIRERVKAKFVDLNIKAFAEGRKISAV